MTGSTGSPHFDTSVVIPVLNAERYLPALLESIEGQTLLPKEIVIGDSSASGKMADLLYNRAGTIIVVSGTISLN